MRLVHLSDLHLGFRQFQRTTPEGMNQREADIAKTFSLAIDRVIAVRPDVVLIGGDVFHTVRPTNVSILHAFREFSRLVRALPDSIVVMVAGNHDMPRSSETTCILRLFSPLGIHVVDRAVRRLRFPERNLSILAVPDLPPDTYTLEPDPEARHNVLLLHGEVEGILPDYRDNPDRATTKVSVQSVSQPEWGYVALGHYHVYRQVGPNAYYSGSIDYSSTNVWGEIEEQRRQPVKSKGMIERDLEAGKQTFHRLAPAREFLDLRPIDGRGRSAADLDDAIAAAVDSAEGGIDGKVVRLVARDVPRHVTRELDHKLLRDYQRRALHFHLDTRRPETIRREASGAPGRRPSLADTLRESLRSRVLTPDVDRERLIDLGLHYLAEAEQVEALRGVSTPDPDAP